MCFAGGLILITLLTFTHEKYQVIIQSNCAIIFVVLAILFTKSMGLIGFVYAGLIANVVRIIITCLIGIINTRANIYSVE